MPRGRIKPSPVVVGILPPSSAGIALPRDPSARRLNDREAIARTLEDYIQAWSAGDAQGMERCLHPEMTARLLQAGPGTDDAEGIRLLARAEGIHASLGNRIDPLPLPRRHEATILDMSGHSASARIRFGDWVAYAHLSFTGDRWAIVNLLWEWLSPRDRRSA